MPAKIDHLSDEQIHRMHKHRQKWIDRALRTDWNPEQFRETIPDVYRAAKLDPPNNIITVDSPIAGLRMISNLKKGSTQTKINGHVSSSDLQIETKGLKWVPPDDGAGYCYCRAFYSFFLEEFGIGETLRPYYKIDESGAFWWWFYDTACIGVAPPHTMRFDQGDPDRRIPYRFHCEDGPAVIWPDGLSLYFWKGINIPSRWIEEKDSITATEVFEEQNQERKRVLGEILGWERILESVDGKRIQRDDYGELWEAQMPGCEHKSRFIRIKCPSTDRVYVNPVPSTTNSCRSGLAWRFGVDRPEEYAPLQES